GRRLEGQGGAGKRRAGLTSRCHDVSPLAFWKKCRNGRKSDALTTEHSNIPWLRARNHASYALIGRQCPLVGQSVPPLTPRKLPVRPVVGPARSAVGDREATGLREVDRDDDPASAAFVQQPGNG